MHHITNQHLNFPLLVTCGILHVYSQVSLCAIACYYSNGYLGETHRKGIAWQQRWEELRRDNVEKRMCTREAEKNILVTLENLYIYKVVFKYMTPYSFAFSDVMCLIYPKEIRKIGSFFYVSWMNQLKTQKWIILNSTGSFVPINTQIVQFWKKLQYTKVPSIHEQRTHKTFF